MLGEHDTATGTSPSATAGAPALAARLSATLTSGPDRVTMRYLSGTGAEIDVLTSAQIDQRARAVAAGLEARGLPGRRAVIVLEPGAAFLDALVGCLYAGVVAIPAPEPRPGVSLQRTEAIVAASGAAAVVTSQRLASELRARAEPGGPLAALPLLDIAALGASEGEPSLAGLNLAGDAPVIVQYTSGSTGTPRGVVLTSDCLLANVEMQTRGMGVAQTAEREILINWMPHFHDLGLIGKILTPLLRDMEVIHLPPLAFVQRPARWLQAIHRYRATVSGAPAFAFDLCAERVPEALIDELDLSSWRVAFCGAEPVFASTLAAFRRRFARAGFRPQALFTCYGLAETTLYAAGGADPAGETPAAADDPHARAPTRLDAASRAAIRIVDAAGRPLPDGAEGEIWVAGPSVAAGYLDDPEATAQIFRARLEPSDGRYYLRSGDLGRIEGDALHVTGRIKDVLIVAGVNHAAADLERCAVAGVEALNPNGAAAFQREDAGGAVVLLLERRRRGAEPSDAELVRRARRNLMAGLGLAPDEVRILRPGALPRTTSGKIRRKAAAALPSEEAYAPIDAVEAVC